jgi:hypothetical protein
MWLLSQTGETADGHRGVLTVHHVTYFLSSSGTNNPKTILMWKSL